MSDRQSPSYPVVNAHNEWDPLEEIIVGTVEGALVPPWDVIMEATLHREELWEFSQKAWRHPLARRAAPRRGKGCRRIRAYPGG